MNHHLLYASSSSGHSSSSTLAITSQPNPLLLRNEPSLSLQRRIVAVHLPQSCLGHRPSASSILGFVIEAFERLLHGRGIDSLGPQFPGQPRLAHRLRRVRDFTQSRLNFSSSRSPAETSWSITSSTISSGKSFPISRLPDLRFGSIPVANQPQRAFSRLSRGLGLHKLDQPVSVETSGQRSGPARGPLLRALRQRTRHPRRSIFCSPRLFWASMAVIRAHRQLVSLSVAQCSVRAQSRQPDYVPQRARRTRLLVRRSRHRLPRRLADRGSSPPARPSAQGCSSRYFLAFSLPWPSRWSP